MRRTTTLARALSVTPFVFSLAAGLNAADFVDPAAPVVHSLPAMPAPAAQKNPDATFHAAPKPLPKGAVTQEWPCFLGPTHNEVSAETKLLKQFPKDGLKLVWEATRGSGYAAPAVVGDRLLMFHRVAAEEVVECLHRETGERFWRFAYAAPYRDRYGYNDGPRAAPIVAGESVFTLGVSGLLHCVDLSTGRERWSRDLKRDFKLKQNFFGCGTTPLVEGDKLIVNVGAKGGPTVAAFDVQTGKMIWGAGDEWGQSYASPIPADVHGKRRVFVFAGGESRPPNGGLMCIDPANGKVDFTFPWRGDRVESVNGSSPLIFGGDRVLVSECYGSGGALVQVAADVASCKPLWTNPSFGAHFMVPVFRDGFLYGVDGHGPQDAFLVCVNAATGKEIWRTQPEWKESVPPPPGPRLDNGTPRELTVGTYRAWLMPIGDDSRMLYLGEYGHLLWVDVSPQGYKALDRTRLFLAPETWTPPVLSRGLLYICQNAEDRSTGKGPRLLCYDLRGTE